jgi:cobalamin biosynthesis Mg chelatase CobN
MPEPSRDNDDLLNGDKELFASDAEPDWMVSSAADVESAGRSCMVILALLAVIVALLLVWVILTSTGATH